MIKKRGLGKSLDALLAYTRTELNDSPPNPSQAGEAIISIAIDKLQPGKNQPRRAIQPEALNELAESIRSQGIIQPLIIRPLDTFKFEIIAGERRWRAAQIAGVDTVPVIIRQISDEDALAIGLIENIQRENLNPIEEAIALERLCREFNLTHSEIATIIGKSRATISNLLRLLSLPAPIQDMLTEAQLEMGHARSLITLPAHLQHEAANEIATRKLSVRAAESYVRKLQIQNTPTKSTTALSTVIPHPDLINTQEKLTNLLKLRVALQCNAKGKGKLVVHYRSLAELNGLLAHFQE